LRVIAGQCKGRKLKVPVGPDIRPITDQIKEALFNTIGPYLEGQAFLDLFAGSGAVGIEALSRMAENAVFVEYNPQAVKIIKDNLDSCQLASRATVIRGDVFVVVDQFIRKQRKFDIVYIDPPFRQDSYYSKIMDSAASLLGKDGIVIIRSPKSLEMPITIGGLNRYRCKSYGDSVLNYYRK